MSIHTDHIPTIVACAKLAVELGGFSKEDALDMALKQTAQTATDALTRDGIFASETSSELLDSYRELWQVCRDFRSGYVSPTIGDIWQYALDQL